MAEKGPTAARAGGPHVANYAPIREPAKALVERVCFHAYAEKQRVRLTTGQQLPAQGRPRSVRLACTATVSGLLRRPPALRLTPLAKCVSMLI
jgi:hypothetical protein